MGLFRRITNSTLESERSGQTKHTLVTDRNEKVQGKEKNVTKATSNTYKGNKIGR